ncbi:MAG: oligopeptide/dipeptide ABC transporter ATP-binding protein [Candidatus Competibacteraceae bacterium]|jgi:oligopeptide/dipeptide ABC transporter ATP-binding protein|nr:oligopeptide/dipeptide ABC transporter ATP-binding protein [Candidatus Competibacteraceae bacterium]
MPLLAAQALVKQFASSKTFGRSAPPIQAVNGVDIAIESSETLGLVGESGCGKSTLARLLGLIEAPDRGLIRLADQDVTTLSSRQLKPLRRRVQMVFQDPFSSLNPRLSVASILAEPLQVHRIGTAQERRERCAALLQSVGLDPAGLTRYPHEFSGGQRQRIAIARALALEPELIIADEPLSALDVSVQSQILNLLAELKERLGIAYLLISHDLVIVNHLADRVAVMYLGRIVETAPRHSLFRNPAHPYTRSLLDAVPVIGRRRRTTPTVADFHGPSNPLTGCPYHPRCSKAQELCREHLPKLTPAPQRPPEHRVACHFPAAR